MRSSDSTIDSQRRRRRRLAALALGLLACAVGFIITRHHDGEGEPAVADGAALTPSRRVSGPVTLRPLAPIAGRALAASTKKVPAPTTTIVVLKLTAAAVSLVASADKPFPFVAPPAHDGHGAELWRIADATGQVLAEGPLDLPRLCTCPEGHDHYAGCAVVPHEAVVRVHLPRVARAEKLTLLDARGELASFSLEDPS